MKLESPSLVIAPLKALTGRNNQAKSCSSGCGGGCGSGSLPEALPATAVKPVEIHTGVPFSKRRLNLSATPDKGTFVSVIDLDLTVACNLRCTYCFKEKWNEHMEDQVAFDALIWLLYASGPMKDVYVNFMGGEPLIRFQTHTADRPFRKAQSMANGQDDAFWSYDKRHAYY